MPSSLELLAPAGSLDVFQTAVDCGANAVYIGAPTANARALARHFTLEEIAAMTDYAHQRAVKLYVAMNSLIKEEELPTIIRLLSVFTGIGIDGLIIQDLGIYHLARRYFPELRLHASTLLGAHNSISVRQFAEMGFKRVVLAREMNLSEIAAAHASSPVEIEVFIHGAMCFAYSGLCLFSSFLGGKSGLRGRCVQPCRRKYSWQGPGAKGGGYLFSMNDLEGISLISALQKAGVTSLKIEGRMRSRQYVGAVVKAYRMVLDHPNEAEVLGEAQKILGLAMGRKTTTGYFLHQSDSIPSPQTSDGDSVQSPLVWDGDSVQSPLVSDGDSVQSPLVWDGGNALITHQYSGNIGLFLGKLTKCKPGGKAEIKLREPLAAGDRIRIHNEKSGDRDSLTLKELLLAGKPVAAAVADQTIGLIVPESARIGDPVYKVDSGESRQESARLKGITPHNFKKLIVKEQQRERIQSTTASVCGQSKTRPTTHPMPTGSDRANKGKPPRHDGRRRLEVKVAEQTLPWWVKIDDFSMLRQLPRHNQAAKIVVLLTKETFRQSKRVSLSTDQRRGLIWALPPVILEADLAFYRHNIPWLVKQGFQDWQLSHIGQRQFFREEVLAAISPEEGRGGKGRQAGGNKKPDRNRRLKLIFYGHYSLNVMNSQTLKALAEAGIATAQVAIEVDRDLLANIAQHKSGPLGMTVYGFPPLFTSRAAPDFFSYEQKFTSPKGEGFVLKKSFDQTLAVPVQPFSLLDRLQEIKAAGLDYVVIDLTANLFKRGDLDLLWRRLDGGHSQERLSSFNYRGTLQ